MSQDVLTLCFSHQQLFLVEGGEKVFILFFQLTFCRICASRSRRIALAGPTCLEPCRDTSHSTKDQRIVKRVCLTRLNIVTYIVTKIAWAFLTSTIRLSANFWRTPTYVFVQGFTRQIVRTKTHWTNFPNWGEKIFRQGLAKNLPLFISLKDFFLTLTLLYKEVSQHGQFFTSIIHINYVVINLSNAVVTTTIDQITVVTAPRFYG